jgi:transcriptional regulator GlxA family with amidase domain
MQRVCRAQQLLETSDLSIERIASKVGFASATNLRERFLVVVGTSPTAYRRTFGGDAKGMLRRRRG